MAQNKVFSYIGFCKRARKITLGSSAIGTLKSGVYLLLLDKTAANNTIRYALKFKRKFNCPLLVCGDDFEELIGKPQCRLAAIRDKNLAEAIMNCKASGYELYIEGGE